MSRRPQHQPPLDTTQPEVPEDELLSATGEGDEVMEEAEEQEGYSACQTLSLLTYSNHVHHPSPLSYRSSRSFEPRLMPSRSCRLTHQRRRRPRHP